MIRTHATGLLLLAAVACAKAATNDRSDTTRGADTTSAPTTPAATTPVPSTPAATHLANSTDSAAQVVLRYYDDIQRRDFAAAFALWSDGGRASGQSRDAFAAGFSQTSRVSATIAGPVSVEGAAGSQYATVPVDVDATLVDGKQQHFAGSYVLRRAMVDGATAEQRQWRIYSAAIRPR
ncbi:MAG TPA: hypothetical protein VLJ83_08085 [Gemmatimonadaceae bacterium]|nr:hypothetical protein [Gemmatimonadaceae bacterium]